MPELGLSEDVFAPRAEPGIEEPLDGGLAPGEEPVQP
jgi:hypothetical protein